jgi:hypothetical protein
LAKNKLVFKKIDKEIKQHEEVREKKRTKLAQKKLGYMSVADFDVKYEKKLLKVATKGVVKLFNSIYEFRKKLKDEKEIEGKIVV